MHGKSNCALWYIIDISQGQVKISLELHLNGYYLRSLFRFLFSVFTRHPNCAIDNIIPMNTLTISNARILELHTGEAHAWMHAFLQNWDVYQNESRRKNWKYHDVDMYKRDSIKLFGRHIVNYYPLCKLF
jgi:hypothetical protein